MKIKLDADGIAELTSKTSKLGRDLTKRAEKVAAAQRRRCPVDTGFLRDSITVFDVEVTPEGLMVAVGPTADYSLYVEFGTRLMAAQPFIRPSIDEAL